MSEIINRLAIHINPGSIKVGCLYDIIRDELIQTRNQDKQIKSSQIEWILAMRDSILRR